MPNAPSFAVAALRLTALRTPSPAGVSMRAQFVMEWIHFF
jgi:hypothetical protein